MKRAILRCRDRLPKQLLLWRLRCLYTCKVPPAQQTVHDRGVLHDPCSNYSHISPQWWQICTSRTGCVLILIYWLLLYINIVPRLFLTIGCTRGDMWLPDKHHPCWPLETYSPRSNKWYVQFLQEPNSDVAMQCKTNLIQTTFFSSSSLQCHSACVNVKANLADLFKNGYWPATAFLWIYSWPTVTVI